MIITRIHLISAASLSNEVGPPQASRRSSAVRHLRRLRPVRATDAATTILPSADRLSTRVRNADWFVLAKGDH